MRPAFRHAQVLPADKDTQGHGGEDRRFLSNLRGSLRHRVDEPGAGEFKAAVGWSYRTRAGYAALVFGSPTTFSRKRERSRALAQPVPRDRTDTTSDRPARRSPT